MSDFGKDYKDIVDLINEVEHWASTFAPPKEVHKKMTKIRKLLYEVIKSRE